MLTTATEKVKLWRVEYEWCGEPNCWEKKVRYFTELDKCRDFHNTCLRSNLFKFISAEECTAVVTYNKE